MLVPLLALIPLLVLPAIRATPAPTVAIPATPVKRQDTPTVSVKFALTSNMILDVNPNGPEILFYGPTEFDNLPVESGVAYPVAETIDVFSISGTQVSVVAQCMYTGTPTGDALFTISNGARFAQPTATQGMNLVCDPAPVC